jgi:hypothetical protein
MSAKGQKQTSATALLTEPHSRSRKRLICCLLDAAEYKRSKDCDCDCPNACKDEGPRDQTSLQLLSKASDVALDFTTSNKDCINSEAAMASTPVSLHIGGTNVANW